MDSIQTIYKELFTIKFFHDNYGSSHHNSLSDDIRILPDEQTKKLFTNFIMDCRLLDNAFVCFIRCILFNPPNKEPKIPFVKFPDNQRYRFLLQAGSNFFKTTIIDIVGSKQVYQFSNRKNVGTNNFITQHEDGVNNDDLFSISIVNPEINCLAVVDIYNTGAINSSYDIFKNTEQQLLSPLYLVRFKNK